MTCRCTRTRFVRSLEEDDFGFPENVERLGATQKSMLGRCRTCGTWWERTPHEVYGYAWFYTEQAYWDASDEQRAVAGWASARRKQGF
jgi:hypothetical protein